MIGELAFFKGGIIIPALAAAIVITFLGIERAGLILKPPNNKVRLELVEAEAMLAEDFAPFVSSSKKPDVLSTFKKEGVSLVMHDSPEVAIEL